MLVDTRMGKVEAVHRQEKAARASLAKSLTKKVAGNKKARRRRIKRRPAFA